MRFLKYLEKNKYESYNEMYINYNRIKKKIGLKNDQKEEIQFINAYDEEFNRVFEFVETKYSSLCIRVKFLENNERNGYKSYENELIDITNEMYCLTEFIRINGEGFKRVLRKHDKITGINLSNKYKKEIKSRLQQIEELNSLIYRISRLKLKKIQIKNEEESNKDFIRKTRKYWVNNENLLALKMKILKKLPVYVFNKNPENGTPFSLWDHKKHDTCISSVYFDNANFNLYKERMKKSQGAEAIRIRWYGSFAPETVFIERKKHEESWTGEKSKKQRFKLNEKYVLDFINGKNVWEQVKKENGEDVFNLYKTIQFSIINKKLRPVVRTFYKRTAFQLPNDSRVRISLDTNLTMIKESTESEINEAVFPLTKWRRCNINCEWPFESLAKDEIERFPYSILEIKTKGADETKPEWIENLLACSYVEHVHKFSKFIHGCAILFPKIDVIPYWLPQLDVDIRKDPYHSKKPSNIISYDKIKKIPGESDFTTSENLSIVNNHCNRIVIPKRIEPKVFFANERTFLKWIQFAIFLGGVGTALFGIGDYEASLCGCALNIVAVLFTFYGLYLYYWRNKKIILKDIDAYDDLTGPTLLIIIFVAAMMISVIFKVPFKKKFI